MPSSSIAIPTTATPWPAKSLWSLLKLGISRMQGTHHVAQKFTTTTLPESAAVSRLPPPSFDAWGNEDGAGAAAGAAALTTGAAAGAGLFRNARYSAGSPADAGTVASTFSSGSTIAEDGIDTVLNFDSSTF